MATVLVTRPRVDSERLAQMLKQHGFDSVIEPLLTIKLTTTQLPDIKAVQAVMITSANALDALAEGGQSMDTLLDLPCFCVGSRTAERAGAFGFRNTHAGKGDGIELAELIAAKNIGKLLLHIAGQDTDRKAQNALEQRGFEVIFWPVYTALSATALTETTVQLIRQHKLDAVLAFSVRTAQALMALLKKHELEACCESLSAIGLSDAVTDVLGQRAWRRIVTATEPNEDAVIECLKRLYPVP